MLRRSPGRRRLADHRRQGGARHGRRLPARDRRRDDGRGGRAALRRALARAACIDGWLVDETDAAAVAPLEDAGLLVASVPLWMRDLDTSAALAGEAIDLGERLRAER